MSWDSKSEYYEEVDSDAREVVKACAGTEDCHETIDEYADSAVMYHADADDIVRFSRNDNAVFDQMGSDALTGCASSSEVATRTAFFAYHQDVNDAIYGFDEDDVNEILERGSCEACDEVVALSDLDDNNFCPNCDPLLQLAAVANEEKG